MAVLRSIATKSAGIRRTTLSRACFRLSAARASADWCRALIATEAIGDNAAPKVKSYIACSRSASPAPVAAEIRRTETPAGSSISGIAPRSCRSILFSTTTLGPAARAASRISRSSGPSPARTSSTTRRTSASASASFERAMPRRSTTSAPCSRMPAVSSTRKGTPLMARPASSTSRVVPATSVTMARSACSSAFSRLDLPTLGRPTMAREAPSRSRRPPSAVESRRWASSMRPERVLCIRASGGGSISSGKSMEASSSAKRSLTGSRRAMVAWASRPSIWPSAVERARSVRALDTSAIASAWVRSRRPPRKARLVNSPGAASRAPRSSTAASRRCTTAGPAWHWSSTTSSVV
ncbi:hypothetical protein D3C87_1347630 [compost metagenome]